MRAGEVQRASENLRAKLVEFTCAKGRGCPRDYHVCETPCGFPRFGVPAGRIDQPLLGVGPQEYTESVSSERLHQASLSRSLHNVRVRWSEEAVKRCERAKNPEGRTREFPEGFLKIRQKKDTTYAACKLWPVLGLELLVQRARREMQRTTTRNKAKTRVPTTTTFPRPYPRAATRTKRASTHNIRCLQALAGPWASASHTESSGAQSWHQTSPCRRAAWSAARGTCS